MIFSETKIVVRYAETDQMGIVHHSNYPIWYEAGRTDLIKEFGCTYSEMEKKGVMLPLLSLTSNYRMPAFYEDELIVKAFVEKMTYTRITFGYEVYKVGEDKPINTGTTSHVWTDMSLKPVNLKKYNEELYNLIAKE